MILTYETNTRQGKVFNIKAWNVESNMKSPVWSDVAVFKNHTEETVGSKFFKRQFLIVIKSNSKSCHNNNLIY